MRKCTRKSCRKELPTKKLSDKWQALGYCDLDCMAGHGYDRQKDIRERQQAKQEREAMAASAAERKAHRERKERVKSRTEWLNEAQAVFNQYIRLRDAGLPCISCGITSPDVQYHAGHYRTRKAAPQLRFDEAQVWLQCATCNNHLSGNLINYRRELLKRIGQAEVDRIECDNTQAKWTIDDAKRIKSEYSQRIKELKRQP